MNPINFNYRMMLIMLIVWTIWYFHKSNRTKSKAPERLWRNLGSFKFPVTKRNIWCKIPVLLEVTPHTNLQVLKVIPHISLQVRITNKPSCSGNWIECHEITCNCFLKNYSSEALKIELVLKVVWSLYSKIRIYRECIIVNIIVIPKDDEKPLSYSICHAGVF